MDQHKLLFWLQIHHSDNVILRTMTVLNHNEFVAVCAKYSHDVDLMTARKTKRHDIGQFCTYCFILILTFIFILYYVF